jgi:tripartite-type tricarboxylate transporter receptor subunit TctC
MARFSRRDFVIGCAVGGVFLGLGASDSAIAQTYPNKPIKLIVAASPGGTNDLRARQIAPKLSEALGQPVVVDNRPGGNGIIAAQAVAQAPADGHTLLLGNSSLIALNLWLFKTLPYNAEKDFIPVTLVAAGPLILAINPKVPATSLAELVALAKSRPGQMSYSTAGRGGPQMLLMEQIKAKSGVDIVSVGYKSNGAEIPDLIAGHIQIGFNYWSVLSPYVKSGKLRALAVASANRLAVAPEIPTLSEAGFAGMEVLGWNGMFVAVGTPKVVVDKLQAEIARALKLPEIRDSIIDTGAEVGGNSSDEFAAFVRADRIKMGKWIEQLKIAPE